MGKERSNLILTKTKDSDSAQAQFSIYKISDEEVRKACNITHEISEPGYAKEVIKALTYKIVAELSGRRGAEYNLVEFKGFSGLIFKTIHTPLWYDMAHDILEHNEHEGEQPCGNLLLNVNTSYVLFYPHDKAVYTVTGGFGSHRIRGYIEKNFGLYLLPKLITDSYPAVKSLMLNNLLGNQAATHRTNKNSTSIFMEKDMNSVFRQIDAEAGRDIAEKLGIEFDEGESPNKKLNMINKDSLVIRRSLTLEELKRLIGRVSRLEKARDNFALNYLVPASKKRLKNSELIDDLVNALREGKAGHFLLTGENYTAYYSEADNYILKDEAGKKLLNKTEPIAFNDIIGLIPESERSNTSLQIMLKTWTIAAFGDDGSIVLQETKVIDAIQGFVEHGENKMPCILFNGLWYVIDDKYADSLTKDYKKVFDSSEPVAKALTEEFELLNDKASNENSFNDELRKNKRVLVAHTALVNYIEIADAIFWDDDSVYLMHNKNEFNGQGARDVVNQVLTSSEYLHQALSSSDAQGFLERYYDAIKSRYEGKAVPFNKEEFISQMRSGKKFTYVIGYMDGPKRNSRSTYAKYLTVDAARKLEAKGDKCIIMGLK